MQKRQLRNFSASTFSPERGIGGIRHFAIVEHDSADKMNTLQLHALTWVNIKHMTLIEKQQVIEKYMYDSIHVKL